MEALTIVETRLIAKQPRIAWLIVMSFWRDVRAVEGGGLENR